MATKDSFEDKLKDLNLSNDEMKRLSDAFKNDEFRKLFAEYAEELNDPKNRELYEQEIRAVEEQRGSDVTFVHPNPGHVLKTSINGKKKCFINIATNEHVEKPSYQKIDQTTGKKGAHWSLPHCLAGPHEDIDHDSKACTVYDVIFSPDTYRMAETNSKFMSMVEDSAVESVEKNYQCQLDRKNIKRLKMKFKGVPKATIIRKKNDNHTENASKHESEEIVEKAITTAQNHKVVLSSHNRAVNPPPSSDTTPPPQAITPRTDENGFTIPTYRIVHRGEVDMQDCTNSLVPQVRSMRPKELIVEIDLPLCASSNTVDLDVCERSLKLHCDSPKYSLDLPLPYPVRESDSHARFDKKQRKLLITLAVIKETSVRIEVDTNVEMEETTEQDAEIIPITNERMPSIDKPVNVTFISIPFECRQGLAHLAVVLYVKNVDEDSVKIENDGQHITIQLSSLGSGYYPLHHQLCLDFDEPMALDASEKSMKITFNDENVLLLLKKTANDKPLVQFAAGTTREDMKTNSLAIAIPGEKSNSLSKEDFLVERSDSSSSDQQKKLSKKQTKKMAKENRKNQPTTDENDKLVNKISKITLQATPDEQRKHSGKILSEEKEDDLPDLLKVPAHPSVYRRHMSESQVDLDSASNGEFKLKGILKNSTKYRSYSESFSESLPTDFQREESVFESCPTTDDLTSSNENNSIVASPDSAGSTSGSSANVKHVTFNNQVSRKTFKPGGPVSGMRKMSTNEKRKLKKRKRQDSLNSQSSDPDEATNDTPPAKPSNEKQKTYQDPVDFEKVISWQASGSQANNDDQTKEPATKSAVRFTNPLIFELDN